MTHDSARLSALVDGELDRETRERVLAHLAGCAQCRAIVDSERRLRGFLSGLAEYCTPGPSEEFLDGLLRLGRGAGAAGGPGVAGGVAGGSEGSDAGETAGVGQPGRPGRFGSFGPFGPGGSGGSGGPGGGSGAADASAPASFGPGGSGDWPFGPAADDGSTAQGVGGLPSTFPSSPPGSGFAEFFPGSLPSAYADDSALLSDPDAARQDLAREADGTSTRPVRQPLPSLAATDRSLRLAGTAAAFLDIVGSSRLRRRVTVGVVGAASVVGMTAALVFAVGGPTTEDGPGPAPADVVSPARQLARNHTRGSSGEPSGTGTNASDGSAQATATASPGTPTPTPLGQLDQPGQPDQPDQPGGANAQDSPTGLPMGQRLRSSPERSFVAPQVSGR